MIEPIWLLIIPLLTGFSLVFIDYFLPRLRSSVVIGSGLVIFTLAVRLLARVSKQPVVYKLGSWNQRLGINLVVDQLSGLLVLLIAFISCLIIWYSLTYIETDPGKYYTLLFLLIFGLMGMTMTGDLFNLFVFLEVTSLTSYALVAFEQTEMGYEASFKYLIIGSVSGFLVLLGIILVYQTTGTLNLAQLVGEAGQISLQIRRMVIVLFTVGLGTKFALVPFHTWLPDAHPAAPSPISALLSGVVIKIYLYALIRLLLILCSREELITLNFDLILTWLGVITLLTGHLLAYQQQNLKRLLAYSSISQIGYILIGVGLFTAGGLEGSIYHIINHALVKASLFLAAGVFVVKLKTEKISELSGAGYKLPLSSFLFTISSVAIIGLPPFNIFISKWLIAKAALEAKFIIPGFSILLGTILALTYYLRVIKKLYTKVEIAPSRQEVSWSLNAPCLVLSLLCFLLGVLPKTLLSIIIKSSVFLLKPINYSKLLLGG
jgi:proton-translocating NADH-quinone oxidoreductase chain M